MNSYAHFAVAIAGSAMISPLLTLPAPNQPDSTGTIIYVDDDGSERGDGLSWNTCLKHLQDALSIARLNPLVKEIRVAQGSYTPDLGEGFVKGDIHAAFDLVGGVALRGGYAGINASDPDLRDFESFETTLSGDLDNNDGPDFANYSDNSYRIVRTIDLSPLTFVEGFTLSGSQWNIADHLFGGALYIASGGLIVHDCIFEFNLADYGAGIGIWTGSVEVTRCVFRDNKAVYGAGMHTLNLVSGQIPAAALIQDSEFIRNICSPIEDGGAIRASSTTVIRNCTFIENRADDGGAICGGPTVENSYFEGNYADYGGAICNAGYYKFCVFNDNLASSSGGVFSSVHTGPGQAVFANCLFLNNKSANVAGGASYGGSAFINCLFLNNESGFGAPSQYAHGGAIEAHAPILIANCEFSGNHSPGAGGAIFVKPNVAATIINCSFANNTAVGSGAAVSGPALVTNCAFDLHISPPVTSVASINYSCAPQSLPPGIGNVLANPQFNDPTGPDKIPGTIDDDLSLKFSSACIDAGDSLKLPPDQYDLDGDGDTAEPLPLDVVLNNRIMNLPSAVNVGVPSPNGMIIDIGAHEYRRPTDVVPAIGDGIVNVPDLLAVIQNWGPCAECPGDVNRDDVVDLNDIVRIVIDWG